MKEEEARTKWCPMARAVPDAQGYSAGNRFENTLDSPLDNKCKCIASDCAMWVTESIVGTDKTIPPFPVGGHCGLIK